MRSTKITTAVALTAVSASLLLLSFTSFAEGQHLEMALPGSGTITAEFIGVGGQMFRQGQNVEIKWVLSGDGVRALESNRWSECELFFSAGGKRWTRITPALSVSRRSYDWTVPDVSAEQGIIAIQIGIEGEGEFYFFRSEPFMIQRGRR